MIKAIQNILKTIVGDKAQNDLKKIRPLVDQVLAEDQKMSQANANDLAKICNEFIKSILRESFCHIIRITKSWLRI